MTDITKIHEALTAYRYAKACESGAGAYGIAEARMIREFEENAPKWVEELIEEATRKRGIVPDQNQTAAVLLQMAAERENELRAKIEALTSERDEALTPTRGGYVHPQLHAQIVSTLAKEVTALLTRVLTWRPMDTVRKRDASAKLIKYLNEEGEVSVALGFYDAEDLVWKVGGEPLRVVHEVLGWTSVRDIDAALIGEGASDV